MIAAFRCQTLENRQLIIFLCQRGVLEVNPLYRQACYGFVGPVLRGLFLNEFCALFDHLSLVILFSVVPWLIC